MADKIVLDLLFKQRDMLLAKKIEMIADYDKYIKAIETSIEELSGKQVWEYEPADIYDDTNHDYIKQSVEEI